VKLEGLRVVVTRPEPRNEHLAGLLRDRGAVPIVVPVIEIAELEMNDRIRDAVTGFVEHDWVLFTSANAVDVFARRLHDFYDPVLEKSGEPERIPGLFAELASRTRIGAVGEGTTSALATHGVEVYLMPPSASGVELAKALGPAAAPGLVLLPRSEAADADMVDELRANGWAPLPVALYGPRTADVPPPAAESVRSGGFDALTFASASAVRAFVELIGSPSELGLDRDGRERVVICIGPKTARAAADAGFAVTAMAEERSDGGLVKTLAEVIAPH